MAGFTQAYQQTLLDYAFPLSGATDHIAYSSNGTSEASIMPRTAIGATGWAAATAATPSVKANNAALTTGDATGAGSISHSAIFSAASGGTQKTDWQPLVGGARSVSVGDKLTWAPGAKAVSLD